MSNLDQLDEAQRDAISQYRQRINPPSGTADRNWAAIEAKILAQAEPLIDDFVDERPNDVGGLAEMDEVATDGAAAHDQLAEHRRRRTRMVVLGFAAAAAVVALSITDLGQGMLASGARVVETGNFAALWDRNDTHVEEQARHRRVDTRRAAPAPTAAEPRVAPAPALEPEVEAELDVVPEVETPEEVNPPPRRSTSKRSRKVEPTTPPVVEPPSASTLRAEARLLSRARAALRDDQPQRALSLLDEHASSFANGALSPERAVLRVQALCDLGRDGEAKSAAGRFLGEHPTSPLRARLGHTCAGTGE